MKVFAVYWLQNDSAAWYGVNVAVWSAIIAAVCLVCNIISTLWGYYNKVQADEARRSRQVAEEALGVQREATRSLSENSQPEH